MFHVKHSRPASRPTLQLVRPELPTSSPPPAPPPSPQAADERRCDVRLWGQVLGAAALAIFDVISECMNGSVQMARHEPPQSVRQRFVAYYRARREAESA